MARATIPIGIQPGTRLLHVVYLPDEDAYQLWTHFNQSMSAGTFLLLKRGGEIEAVTLGVDGSESSRLVRAITGTSHDDQA